MMKNTPQTTENNVVTNDLKKGDLVMLRNGWQARIEDNKKGDTRLCTVYGFETEMGSVYSHDMMELVNESGDGKAWTKITHTEKQNKVKAWSDQLFSSMS